MSEVIDAPVKNAREDEAYSPGETAIFAKFPFETGQSYKFSSTLDGVGENFDRLIYNFEKVLVKSSIVELDHSKYGKMNLVKIQSPSQEEMFVREEDIMLERDL